MMPQALFQTVAADPSPCSAYFRFETEGSELRDDAYRLRYQVYCQERGFLSPDDYPDGLERDEFDDHALHILARHIDGTPAGTARLVFDSVLGFPLEPRCELTATLNELALRDGATRSSIAEISRLAVSKDFRRRLDDGLYGGPPRSSRQLISEIISGIYRVIYQESKRRGVTHLVIAVEASLHILLKRMGLLFEAIGPEVDYYGPVKPYMVSMSRLDAHLLKKAPDFFRYLND